MSEAIFSTDDIMNFQAEGGMSTEYTPVPEGEWPAFIKKVEANSGVSEKDPSNPRVWAVLNIQWAITDPECARLMERDDGAPEPIVRQSVFLDVTDEGRLKMGKGDNVQLGRLREAVRQNGPGAWSPGMLEGANGIVNVVHRVLDDGRTVGDVRGVAAA